MLPVELDSRGRRHGSCASRFRPAETLLPLLEELIIFLTAMTPVGELRAAIPLGLCEFDLSWPVVLVIAIAGNLVPVPFILLGLNRLGKRVESFHNPVGTLLRWRSRQVRRRFERVRPRYHFLALTLLVAPPIPFTGAWTGTMAAWAVQMPLRGAIPAIHALC